VTRLIDAGFVLMVGVLLWLGFVTLAAVQNDNVRSQRELAQANELAVVVADNPADADEIRRVASCIAGRQKCSQHELDSQADRVFEAYGRADAGIQQPWPLRWIAPNSSTSSRGLQLTEPKHAARD
jgi:hypothetical protein